MKNEFGSHVFGKLLQIFEKYNKDSEYNLYRDSLFHLFGRDHWFHHLDGMVLFTKAAHRDKFKKDVSAFKRKSNKSNEKQFIKN